MALQTLDDWIGREGDLKNGRPSFYTGYKWNDTDEKQIRINLHARERKYLDKAWQIGGRTMGPIVGAAWVMGRFYPQIVETTEKIGIDKGVKTGRDYSKA